MKRFIDALHVILWGTNRILVKCRVSPCIHNKDGFCSKRWLQIWNYGGCKHLLYDKTGADSRELYNYFKMRDKE